MRPSRNSEELPVQVCQSLDTLKHTGEALESAAGRAARAQVKALLFDCLSALAGGDSGRIETLWDGLSTCQHHTQLEVEEESAYDSVVRVLRQVQEVVRLSAKLCGSHPADVQAGALATTTKRAVILALATAAQGVHLRRGVVHQVAQNHGAKVGPARVGQILDELHSLGVAHRIARPARGGLTSFYRLTPSGLSIWRTLIEKTKRPADASVRSVRPENRTWRDHKDYDSLFVSVDSAQAQ